MTKPTMFAVVLMLVSTFAIAQAPSAGLDDTLDVARLKSYSAARVSSGNRFVASNDDSKRIMPGETLVMADLQGAGIVSHIWLTVADNEFAWPRLLRASRLLRRIQDPKRRRSSGRLLRGRSRLGAQSRLEHGSRQFDGSGAQQLLAHALSQVLSHNSDQRREAPGADVLLPRRLSQVRLSAR